MTLQEFLNKWKFQKDTYYKVIDNVVYRDVKAGLIKEYDFRKTTRKVGKYRIVAQHFDCALPYTNYYLIFDNSIFKTEQHPIWVPNILNDIVNDLKSL